MQTAMVLLCFVAGAVLLSLGSAEDEVYDEGHSRHHYPNPMTHHSLCGRKESSYICDPNTVISESEGLLFVDIKLLHVRFHKFKYRKYVLSLIYSTFCSVCTM